jgi:hypothetical protein
MALAFRHGQILPTGGAALSEASREHRVTWVALEPLTEAEAAELVGERAAAIFTQAGGNPFYLLSSPALALRQAQARSARWARRCLRPSPVR